MEYLKVYKNGRFYGYKLSIERLYNTLEFKYLNITYLDTQRNEIARIRADNDVYSVYK